MPEQTTGSYFYTVANVKDAPAYFDYVKNGDMLASAKQNIGEGFHCRMFAIYGPEGPISGIWETKSAKTEADFLKLMNNSGNSFKGDTWLDIKAHMIDAKVPVTQNPLFLPGDKIRELEPMESYKPTSGSFFIVDHTFVDGKAGDFWAAFGGGDKEAERKKQVAAGVYCHYMMPTQVGGSGPMQSVWESKEDLTADKFKSILGGLAGPNPATTAEVHKAMPGGFYPSAKFPK